MSRRRSREVVLQTLYEKEFHLESPKEKKSDLFLQKATLASEDQKFVKHILSGIQKNKNSIDQAIKKPIENWKMERLSLVDLNIMRIAVFEIMFCPDIPNRSALNEALELAKKFGEEKSAPFINGVLDQVLKNQTFIDKAKENK